MCAGYAERILASVGTLGGLGVGGSGVVQDASRSAVHPHLKTAFFRRGSGKALRHATDGPTTGHCHCLAHEVPAACTARGNCPQSSLAMSHPVGLKHGAGRRAMEVCNSVASVAAIEPQPNCLPARTGDFFLSSVHSSSASRRSQCSVSSSTCWSPASRLSSSLHHSPVAPSHALQLSRLLLQRESPSRRC